MAFFVAQKKLRRRPVAFGALFLFSFDNKVKERILKLFLAKSRRLSCWVLWIKTNLVEFNLTVPITEKMGSEVFLNINLFVVFNLL